MNDLTFCSAISLAKAIREKNISCCELMEAHLAQIERVNPPLNAIVRVLAGTARQRAREADAALTRGDPVGPFHGVPMTVKDTWELAAIPSATGGTLGRANYIPERDATVIARMREAGAIAIGITNVPELAMAFETDNLLYGRTNNPYHLARTPGGSGGGGAVAIAAGMSSIEIGADLGGSIRLPSNFCGIAGIRPTTGRVPMTGYFPPVMLGWMGDFTAAGPMARTVEDLAMALPVISGPDWIDAGVHDMPLGDWRAVRVKGLRVAVHTNNGIMPACPDVAATVTAAARALADAGAIVEEATPTGIDQCLEIFLGIATADAGEGVRAVLAAAGTDRTHAHINAMLALSTEHKLAGALQRLLVQADMFRSRMLSFIRNYDLILCPGTALPAIEHGTCWQDNVLPAFSYTIAYNITGWPGAVIRCGTSPEGLPIGVQAVARPWREDIALAAAQHLEAALGGYQRPTLAIAA